MHKIKAIRSEADYQAALARVDALMDAEPGTSEGEELDVLTDLVSTELSRPCAISPVPASGSSKSSRGGTEPW